MLSVTVAVSVPSLLIRSPSTIVIESILKPEITGGVVSVAMNIVPEGPDTPE
jgi:hypothetical protein